MHTFYRKVKDASQEIAQLWLIREIFYSLLIMIDKNYWAIQILIFTKIRDKLRIGLKSHDILNDVEKPTSLNTKIFMSIIKDFDDSMMRIMPSNVCKANVDSLLCDGTYLFMYDVKITEPRQSPDLGIFYVNNFQVAPVLL